MTIEVNSQKLTAKYYEGSDKIIYQVTVKV